MPGPSKWYQDPRLWLEVFVIVNLGFLALDIYLAHSVNQFHHAAEYVPLYFSMAALPLLVVGLLLGERWGWTAVWRDVGHLVGWSAVLVGLVGVILHLDSRFFNEWTRWVLLLGLGGVFGNFVFSLTDHAQNGFYHWTEWIPVASSALAVGFLATVYLTPVTRRFLGLCAIALGIQVAVGVFGFVLHTRANLHGPSPDQFDNFVFWAPALAPLLFPNLSLLCGIGLWVLRDHLPETEPPAVASIAPGAP